MDEVRAWELGFETRTGIHLMNPFFEGIERTEIQKLKEGKITYEQHILRNDYRQFVEDDLKHIVESDGIVAIINDTVPQIGTLIEIDWAYMLHKPIYIIADGFRGQNHWFFRYMSKVFLIEEVFGVRRRTVAIASDEIRANLMVEFLKNQEKGFCTQHEFAVEPAELDVLTWFDFATRQLVVKSLV